MLELFLYGYLPFFLWLMGIALHYRFNPYATQDMKDPKGTIAMAIFGWSSIIPVWNAIFTFGLFWMTIQDWRK